MSEPLDDDQAREAISDILARLDLGGPQGGGLPGAWVLAYETTGLTEGEVGSNWGWLAHAGIPTIVGLCHLTARDAQDLTEDD